MPATFSDTKQKVLKRELFRLYIILFYCIAVKQKHNLDQRTLSYTRLKENLQSINNRFYELHTVSEQ